MQKNIRKSGIYPLVTSPVESLFLIGGIKVIFFTFSGNGETFALIEEAEEEVENFEVHPCSYCVGRAVDRQKVAWKIILPLGMFLGMKI